MTTISYGWPWLRISNHCSHTAILWHCLAVLVGLDELIQFSSLVELFSAFHSTLLHNTTYTLPLPSAIVRSFCLMLLNSFMHCKSLFETFIIFRSYCFILFFHTSVCPFVVSCSYLPLIVECKATSICDEINKGLKF